MLVEYWLQCQRRLCVRPQDGAPQVGDLVPDEAPNGGVRQWFTVVAVEWPVNLSPTRAYYSLTDAAQILVRVRLMPIEADEAGR